MEDFLIWLQKDTGTFRGQPVANWFHLVVFMIIIINIIIYFLRKKKGATSFKEEPLGESKNGMKRTRHTIKVKK